MLPSQRDQFDVPREVCYLNAAAWSPLPLASVEEGRIAAARRDAPGVARGAAAPEPVREAACDGLALQVPGAVRLVGGVAEAAQRAGVRVAVDHDERVNLFQERGAGAAAPGEQRW